MRIDVHAGEPQFIDHLAPVYLALPEKVRGDFIIQAAKTSRLSEAELIARAVKRKVLPVTEPTDPSRPVLVCSYGDHGKVRKAGRKRIARMEHGIGQSFIDSRHPSYAGGDDADDVGLFLTPNEHSARRWQEAYPGARVEVVGTPKLDHLPKRASGPRPIVAVSFHWGIGAPGHGPLAEAHGSFPEYKDAIASLAGHVRLIGHGHPRMLPFLARYYRRWRIPIVEDFAEVCRQADLYVCDTNSTIYEFASLGRPVVVVNGRHFRRTVNHGLRFDWGTVTNVGVQCNAPGELLGAVTEAFRDTPARKAKREAALAEVYPYRTGGAERAAKALVAWSRAHLREVA